MENYSGGSEVGQMGIGGVMKYTRVAQYVLETPWAILRSKLDEIDAVLQFHMQGNKFSPEELKARFGDASKPGPEHRGAVAVVPLHGVISHRMGGMTEMSGGISTERFAQMFREAMSDSSVSAIVIDANTPGGTITGVTELAAEIFAARGRKPIIAHANALLASAGYWIASSADEIVSTPSGSLGSIGVIFSHVDTSKRDEMDGITRTVIASSEGKAAGHGPLSKDDKEFMTAMVKEAEAVMFADIARGRGVNESFVRDGYGDGRVVSAQRAKKLSMIDRIETFEATVARLLGGRVAAPVAMRTEAAETEPSEEIKTVELQANGRRRLEMA